MITFVTFHVDTDRAAAQHITSLGHRISRWKHTSFKNDYNYQNFINLLFASISIFHHDCKKIVLSDHQSKLTSLNSDIDIYRQEIDPGQLMLERLRSQINFLKADQKDTDFIFVDSDMLVNANLEPVFDSNFSIAFTYTDFINLKDMPINGGLFFVSKDKIPSAITFLEKVFSIYQGKYNDFSAWWGDQYAIYEAIGHERFIARNSNDLTVDGTIIRLLSCERYNYTPANDISFLRSELEDKAVIHFNGNRKRFINLYWHQYLYPYANDSSLPGYECFISFATSFYLKQILFFRHLSYKCQLIHRRTLNLFNLYLSSSKSKF